MAMQWTPDLSVGHPEIDTQHQELITRINALLDAMGHGKGKEEIIRTVRFLDEYVVKHFAMEERHMARLAYPAYQTHRGQHQAFTQNFQRLKVDIETQGATTLLAIQLQRQVCEWLVNHIQKTDKALGAFLQTK